jgi:hypothetical protein
MRLAWTPICIVVISIAVTGSGCGFRAGSDAAVVVRPVSAAGPITFYVDSARGRDSNSGTSPTTPWRSLVPVNGVALRGGDSILLRGGQRFSGTIRLGSGNLSHTSRTSTLRIGSYGERRATIVASPHQDAISAIDVTGIQVSAVNLTGQAPACSKDSSNGYRYGAAGIRVAARRPHMTLDQGISIDHVDVSGFCNGIAVGTSAEGSGISHLHVTAVRAHDNASAGIWTYDRADKRHAISDVAVNRSWAYRNGIRGGIVLFGVDGGRVSRSVAFANGRTAGGGVGIWAFDSTRIVFSRNESYANGSPGIDNDGDGFDFDRGVSDSVMVHNYSHDNGGPR